MEARIVLSMTREEAEELHSELYWEDRREPIVKLLHALSEVLY